MVPQGGRRASGGRGGSGSDAEHLARQSPKNVAQARRFLGLAGAADRGDPPPTSHGGRRCPCHRRVLRRPNSDALSNTSARTLRTRRVAMPIGKVRPGHRETAQGGGCKRALERTVLLKGGLQPPPGRGPAAVFWAGGAPRGGVPTRPTRLRGSTTAGRDPESGDRSRLLDRLHQQSLLSWIAFIDRHGKPGRPDGARSRWRVSPTSSSAPGGRARVSRASSRPRRGPRDRPRSPPPAGVPGGRGRPAPGLGAAAVARPLRPRARVTAVTTREEIACLDSKGSAGGRQSSNLRGEAPTDDGSRPSASSTEVARWTDPLP